MPASATLLAFVVNSVIQIAVVAAGTAAALRLLRSAPARMKHRVAAAGLTLCGAVPLVSAWPAARISAIDAVLLPSVDASAVAGGRAADLLVCAYLALLLGKLASLTRAALAQRALRRTSTPIADGAILASLQRWNRGRRVIRLCRSPWTATPLVCGVVRPAIVFPASWRGDDADLIDAVIAHECAHVARHDVVVTIAVEWLTAPFAAHPAVAALKRAAAMHREVACDEAAAARLGIRRTTYASLLVRLAERRGDSAGAAALGAATHLERRVRELLAHLPRTRTTGAMRVLASLCLLTTAAAAPLTAVVVDAGWRELSGVWTLDVDQSRPRGELPFRAASMRIDATRDHVTMAQRRTRRNGVDETLEIRRTTDDVPSEVTLPGGMTVRTRARWEGLRLVTNSLAPHGDWRERVEATAAGNRLIIRYENASGQGGNRYIFVYRRE